MTDKSNFKQAAWLGISQFCTFALSYVSAAILSRYFDKMEYGTYRQILYVYNTLLILFTAGLPSVFSYFIPRLKSGEQKTLINSLTKIFLALGALFSIALFLLSNIISNILENPQLSLGLKIFSIFPLFTLPAMGVEGIYTAIKETKKIASYVLISKLLMLIFIISPVIFFKSGYIGAVIGWGIANFIIFIMAMYMKSKPYLKIMPEVVPNMYRMIFEYSLPLIGAFIAGFGINCADQFYISRYYGTDTFADFSNGNLTIPFATMITGSVKAVLLPVLSKAQADNNILSVVPVYTNAVVKSIKIVLPIISFAIVYASYLMTFLYSPKYNTSTPYFQMHAIRDFIGAVPYLSVLLAFGFSKVYMKLHIIGMCLVWGVDAVLVYIIKSPAYFIVLTQSALQFFIVIGAFVYVYKKIGINFLNKRLIKEFLKITVHSLLIAFMTFIIVKSFVSCEISTIESLCGLIIGGILFLVCLVFTGRLLKENYLEVLTQVVKKNVN